MRTLISSVIFVTCILGALAAVSAVSLQRVQREVHHAMVASDSALQPEKALVQVGAFTVQGFNAVLALDNTHYEKHKTSSLHAIVTMLRTHPASWTVGTLSTAMKLVEAGKWQKYHRTRTYLETEIPGLTAALRPVPVGFTTIAMTAETGDAILRHRFKWTSDTVGGLQTLANVYTRENVQWPNWPQGIVALIPDGNAPYRVAGQHFGLANNPASAGEGQDDHSLFGPFGGNIVNYVGQPIEAPMSQVYEYSYDRVTWYPIVNSQFTITRRVTQGPNQGHVTLAIIKTRVSNPLETFTVTKVI